MDDLSQTLKDMRQASYELMSYSTDKRNSLLQEFIDCLEQDKHKIIEQNKEDLKQAQANGRNSAFIYKLTLDEKVYNQMLEQLQQIIELDDPVGEIIEERVLDNKALLIKKSVPIGVIGIIYEARPNVTVDVAGLCIKSGNCVILKGGSDALRTNRLIYQCLQRALSNHNIPNSVITFIGSPDREIVSRLVKYDQYIDLIIPRGGYELVKKIQTESTIPILSHSAGGARIFVDQSADLELALKVLLNSKLSRPGACNALDTILLHKPNHEFLQTLTQEFAANGVKVCTLDDKPDLDEEKLGLEVNIILVENIEEAIEHIQKYSKKHSEGIISNDQKSIDKFVDQIDTAAIFINCATPLHDGGIFGLGAEMGISTGKMHARGPVGLKELTSYKWIMRGDGQIRE